MPTFDVLPVTQPFWSLLRQRKTLLGNALMVWRVSPPKDRKEWRRVRDDYDNIIRCLNAMLPTWKDLTEPNLSWLRQNAKHLPKETLAWARGQGFKI